MDQATLITLAVALLSALCIGGVGFVLFGAGENAAAKRVARVTSANERAKNASKKMGREEGQRRKQIQDSLKDLEEKQKEQKKSLTIKLRIERAGLDISLRTFYLASVAAGILVMLAILITGMSPIAALLAGFATGFGVPRWVLGFLIKRRQAAFSEEFANAIDVIVRGVKAGLPVNDCLRIVAQESAPVVAAEFSEVVEGQKVGVTLEEGLKKVYERMPLQEVNFFMITLSIQAKSGGNLSEALGNLSRVLRDRKKMRGKITAMSQEAKSSAAIIGALPPSVAVILYLVSPDYIGLLFTTTLGQLIIAAGVTWMLIGILVMRKMINFDF
ncbi:type II secretion system protein [Tepidicaulis marinus]|uniref:Type II secretion system protein n=1 Tax=Tepidicaulis marinus TaxID=1333998 RepID=A0A081BBB3_9HYPH|nr:type II secretion system F family protein [Tepidicaulis marinus]GAK45331.1 type II secretion system protein [Tepidicaulis marinus]